MKYYADMGFSETEIKNKINDQEKYFKYYNEKPNQEIIHHLEKLVASSSENERYSPSDFISEINLLETMVKEIQKISSDLNMYFYSSLEG